MKRFAAGFALLGLLVPLAAAQLIVGNDDEDGFVIYGIDVQDGIAQPLVSGLECWGLAADDVARRLYSVHDDQLYRISYDTLVPELVGGINEGGSSRSIVGLAWNAAAGKLYGTRAVANEAIFEIDPMTAAATLLVEYDDALYDFGGLEYNASDGKLYALNDDSDAPGGRGLYRIDPAGPTITKLADYPVGQTDIDGLAIGDGRAYLTIDEPGDIYVYNITSGMYEDPLTSPFLSTATTFSGAAWAPGLIPEPAGLFGLLAGALLLRRR